ncbi:hypothetical protein WJU16_08190 [Chitinophaga pollutisoli]|uniref:DUF4843 domain-containing protein n=1 Tax=Chitinophaga pollutisoli TaxID=3133966 RepID=A0ABZ2YUL7_9BACT
MKTINLRIALLAFLAFFASACNKSDDFLYNPDMTPISFSGFNGSGQSLRVQVDTLSKTIELVNGRFNVSDAYTFPEGQKSVKVTVREGTGKVIMEKELRKDDGSLKVNFSYLNGKVGDMPEPPTFEEGKIKLTYMWMPVMTKYDGPVDFAVGKLYFTPKVFEELARVKNVMPGEFCETITIDPFPTSGQTYNGQPTAVLLVIYIYKAGTNEFYTAGTGYNWNITTSAPKPNANLASSKLYIITENPSGSTMTFVKNLEL